MRARVATVLLAGSLALTGCGSAELSPAAKLQDRLAAVVDAANSADLTRLRSAISDLRSTVRAELGAGQITAARARAILTALAAVERDAELVNPAPVVVVTTPPPTTPPPTTPPPTTPPPTSAPPRTPPPTSPPPSPTPTATTPAPTPTAVLPTLVPPTGPAGGKGPGTSKKP